MNEKDIEKLESEVPARGQRLVRAAYLKALATGNEVLIVRNGWVWSIKKGRPPRRVRRVTLGRRVVFGQRETLG